jgi:hypothetical protein
MTVPYLNFVSCCDNLQYSGFSINYFLEDFVVGKTYYFSTVSGCNAYEECGVGVSQEDCCPPNFPTLSGCFTLESYGYFINNPVYTYWQLGSIDVSDTCQDCFVKYPCTTTEQTYFFQKCCLTNIQEDDYFGLNINLGEIWENQVYYIETEYFSGCATSLYLDNIPTGVPIYTPENYTFVLYNNCSSCTANTISCNTTPNVTPTIYYSSDTRCGDGILRRNECDPITLYPMGVECVSVNPTYTNTSDGSLSLAITGGTPPYSVTWDTGFSGPALIDLSVGTYSAVVTDSYGDFVVYQSCTLTAPSPEPRPTPEPTPIPTQNYFCLTITSNDYFPQTDLLYFHSVEPNINGKSQYTDDNGHTVVWTLGEPPYWNLENPPGGSNIISYTTSDPPLTGWEMNGPSGNISSASGQCVSYPDLCLDLKQIKGGEIRTSIATLYYTGLVNGQPSWEAAGEEWILTWQPSTLQSKWVITPSNPSTYWFNITNINPSAPPLVGWTQVGSDPGSYVNVNQGNCTSQSQARINTQTTVNNPETGGDGNVVFKTSGGYPPYEYSIDNGVTFKSSPIFNKLKSGTYSLLTKDSSGNTTSSTVTLGKPSDPITYKVSLITKSSVTTNTSAKVTKEYQQSINIQPSLPDGVTLTFDFIHTNNFKTSTGQTSASLVTNTVAKKNSLTIPYLTSTSTGTTNSRVAGCQTQTIYSTGITDTYQTISYKNSDNLSIITTTTVNKNTNEKCYVGESTDTFYISNATISGCVNCYVQVT